MYVWEKRKKHHVTDITLSLFKPEENPCSCCKLLPLVKVLRCRDYGIGKGSKAPFFFQCRRTDVASYASYKRDSSSSCALRAPRTIPSPFCFKTHAEYFPSQHMELRSTDERRYKRASR